MQELELEHMNYPVLAPTGQVNTPPMAEILARIASELTSTSEMLQTIQQHFSVLTGALDTESSTFKDIQNLDLATQLVADLARAVSYLSDNETGHGYCDTIALSRSLTLQALRGSLCDMPEITAEESEAGALDLF